MSNRITYILEFDDITILESDGSFEVVKKIMEKEAIGHKKWMVESNLQMTAEVGTRPFESAFVLHFYETGSIYIMEYSPSSEEIFSNPDIRGLYEWAVENGWKRIIPCTDLVREKTDFWKHYWETHLVDSEYLDENFGKREEMFEKSTDNAGNVEGDEIDEVEVKYE